MINNLLNDPNYTVENYFKLRLDKSAQWEIRMVSKAMQELINGRK